MKSIFYKGLGKPWADNGILEALLLFLVFYLPSYLSQRNSPDPEVFNDIQFHINYYSVILPQSLLVLVMAKRRFTSLIPMGFTRYTIKDLGSSLLVTAILFLIFFLTASGLTLLPTQLAGRDNFTPWHFSNYSIIPFLFCTCLLTGYGEELFFRGYLLTVFETEGIRKTPAVLLSSLLFAAGHGYESLGGFLFSLLAGIFLSQFFYSQRKIHPLSLGHALYNLLSLLLSSSLLLPGH